MIRIFSTMMEFVEWMNLNCDKCNKYGQCDLIIEFQEAYHNRDIGTSDTWISDELADRLGYTPFGDWQCKEKEHYRYHVDCDDFNHQCSTCKHNEDCTYNCSTCNANSAVCFYELDDDAEPTMRDIADLIEMVDMRLDYMIDLIKQKKVKK